MTLCACLLAVAATMYLDALEQNPDAGAQARLLASIGQSHSQAGTLTDELRPFANAADPAVRAAAKLAATVAQLVALGADPEQRDAGGSTMLDHAKAACPDEVQQALLGRPRWPCLGQRSTGNAGRY